MRARCLALLLTALLVLPSSGADRSVAPIVSRMERLPVDSSALAAVGYSHRLHALEIEFRDGLIYRYLGVPASLHQALMQAESKAQFYNRKVRGRYRCLRVRPPETP